MKKESKHEPARPFKILKNSGMQNDVASLINNLQELEQHGKVHVKLSNSGSDTLIDVVAFSTHETVKCYNMYPEIIYMDAHQVLSIRNINFEQKSILGYVELTIFPLKPDLTSVRLNSKQCSIYRVCVDTIWDAEFTYFEPLADICQGNAIKRNIDYFQKCNLNALNSVDPDLGNGELLVTLPKEIIPVVNELCAFTLCIEFSIQNPKGGIQFVVPDLPGTMAERSAHMFTYGVENCSRLWFPCIDTFSELCTWKVEVTVDKAMTAVSCGDLAATECTEDTDEKTYHYFLSSPTAAPNIALSVGPFEILVDPKMHEVTHFCLPKLMPVLKHTTSYIYQAFEFYEELMSSRYPYSYYKQVFVDESYCDVATYATMSILSTNLLHPTNIIDQTMASRQMMATAVAQQFFGSFIAMQSWSDAWLTKGITGYLSYLFCKKTFGTNEYRNMVMRDMQEVSEYEHQVGFIILDPSKHESNHPFSIQSPHTLSPRYADVLCKKARLIMRMLEIRIGTELLLQVFNKLLSLATNASQLSFSPTNWANMLLSTSSFLKIIYTVTGKDIEPFIDLWVTQGGVARFMGNFVFNRKRNMVLLEIKQDLNAPGALKYVGTLNVTIQELDGSFNHQFKIEENKTKFEITCHSKSRRNKKKKIPLMTGEEVDMDLSAMDADSPVLWLRLDPDMNLLRTVNFEQPDYMWQYQLKFERCIVAQFEAIEALSKFPTPASRYALTNTIESEQCYYRVRQDACYCLAKIANSMVASWTGPPAMITIFRKMFGSHCCPVIVRQNNFSNFHHYYLLKTIPQAMARLRDTRNLCLPDVSKFLLDLFKYNDNSRNKWSDNYFRAALVEAFAASITPAITNVSLITGQVVTEDSLSPDMKPIVEEVVRCLNLEKLMPSYRFTVTVSCLYTIRTLQKFGHLPNESDVFRDYAQPGIFRDVRIAAITCLVDFIIGDFSGDHMKWVLDFIEQDRDPFLRHHAVTCLIQNPPFRRSERTALNIEPLAERIWSMINTSFPGDSRLRCGMADLYYTLYGRQRPPCLPVPESVALGLKEKRSKLGVNSESSDTKTSDLTPSTTTSALLSEFAAQSSAVWNPELSSIFNAPVTSLPDNIMEAEDEGEKSVDVTMISGEQSVAMEESVITETEPSVAEKSEDNDKPSAESDTLAAEDDGKIVSEKKRRSSISRLSEDSLSPPHSPKTDPPEDVVVSLENIINCEPSMPPDIFNPSLPSPSSPKSENMSPVHSPSPPKRRLSDSPSATQNKSIKLELEEEERPPSASLDDQQSAHDSDNDIKPDIKKEEIIEEAHQEEDLDLSSPIGSGASSFKLSDSTVQQEVHENLFFMGEPGKESNKDKDKDRSSSSHKSKKKKKKNKHKHKHKHKHDKGDREHREKESSRERSTGEFPQKTIISLPTSPAHGGDYPDGHSSSDFDI